MFVEMLRSVRGKLCVKHNNILLHYSHLNLHTFTHTRHSHDCGGRSVQNNVRYFVTVFRSKFCPKISSYIRNIGISRISLKYAYMYDICTVFSPNTVHIRTFSYNSPQSPPHLPLRDRCVISHIVLFSR